MKPYALIVFLAITVSLLPVPAAQAGTVTDIDGNVYQTVVIGTQVWMASNLQVTHYANGDSIPIVIADSAAWTGLTTGAACSYSNDPGNIASYGRIYNWYAAADPRSLAPAGWHVAVDEEWKQLEVFLGMPVDLVGGMGNRGGSPVGGKLKESGTAHWSCPNTLSTNETGFTALPHGSLDNSPIFSGLGTDLLFWTASEFSPGSNAAWGRDMTCNLASIGRNGFAKDYGGAIRCVQDAPADVHGNDDGGQPDGFRIVQNYPNPFNPSTTIEYLIPTRSRVVIEIFNVLGQKVRTLVNETKSAGSYRVEWSGSDDSGNSVPTGIYLYRFRAGDVVQIRKMLLVK